MGLAITNDLQDILHGMGFHLFPADGRVCPADPGEQDPEIIVDFRCGGHRGARVPDIDLLLDGDGRGDAFDGFHVRFHHPAQKLPRIGGQAFRKAALPFGEERVKGQRRFSAAGYAGNHNKAVPGNLHRNVLQVVYFGVSDDDVSFCGHNLLYL